MSTHPISPRLLQGRISGKIRSLLTIIFMIAGSPAWADVYQSEYFTLSTQDDINRGRPSTKQLKPSSTHLCVLMRYDGQGAGGRVYKDESGFWVLELLKPVANDGIVRAGCFSTSAFTYPWGNEHWVSENFEVTAETKKGLCGQTTSVGDAWWSDAATILQGHKGIPTYETGVGPQPGVDQTESVRIEQVDQKFVSSKVRSSDYCNILGPGVTAYVNSFFVGAPHSGQLARFFGPLGKGSATQAGEYSVKANYRLTGGAPATVNMAPVDEAVCYFTAIEGVFGTTSNQVSINSNGMVGGKPAWQLLAWSDQTGNNGNDYLSAKARCFLREQPGYPTDGNNPRQICLKNCDASKTACLSQGGRGGFAQLCANLYNSCISRCPK
jgi:hypothetical protein